MYYTLTIIDGEQHLVDHPTREAAETFAHEVAAEGHECRVLQTLSVMAGMYVSPETVFEPVTFWGSGVGVAQ